MICFKYGQVLIEKGFFTVYWPLVIFLFAVGLCLGLSNLHFINLSVKYYDATDVVPVLNAAMLIAEIMCGLVVGGEFYLYDAKSLFIIFLSSLVCIAGIQVLVMKTSQLDFREDKIT